MTMMMSVHQQQRRSSMQQQRRQCLRLAAVAAVPLARRALRATSQRSCQPCCEGTAHARAHVHVRGCCARRRDGRGRGRRSQHCSPRRLAASTWHWKRLSDSPESSRESPASGCLAPAETLLHLHHYDRDCGCAFACGHGHACLQSPPSRYCRLQAPCLESGTDPAKAPYPAVPAVLACPCHCCCLLQGPVQSSPSEQADQAAQARGPG